MKTVKRILWKLFRYDSGRLDACQCCYHNLEPRPPWSQKECSKHAGWPS